ncbi:TRAP transporter solute receptor, TAXI family precursor [hydrothermal vent metagenome]|uniref:TRAP transporter solute receptor, TAXI family n=1 Tax=hydrothermal vent metagenome TaxID=652676 RepID=A0A3B0T5Z3_9ZZZZ
MFNKLKLTVAGVAVATAMTTVMASTAFAQEEFITIGTGGVTGVYYPTGGAICRLVNKGRKEHGVRCSVESTGGSVYNINTIREGELEFGVAQSDWQYHAYNGTSKFEEAGPFEDLRAVFSVHPEPFTVVARADSGIKTFADLKGKRVNLGNPGSGSRGTFEVVLEAMGWSADDFALATELKSSEQSAALCDNQVDAIAFTVGHPSGTISEATTSCDSIIVAVDGPVIQKLIDDNDYYRSATIPGGMYRGSDADVPTFGVGATFVTSAKVSDKAVYTVVASVFDNFEAFKKLHPAFANLDPKEMISDGLSAPLHPGAVKYYKEQGWIE